MPWFSGAKRTPFITKSFGRSVRGTLKPKPCERREDALQLLQLDENVLVFLLVFPKVISISNVVMIVMCEVGAAYMAWSDCTMNFC